MQTKKLATPYAIILYSLFTVSVVTYPARADAQPPATPATPAPAAAAAAEPVAPVINIVGEEFRVELQIGAWATMPSTAMYSDTENVTATVNGATTTTTVNGTNIDFKNTLGLKNKVFPEAHLTIRLAPGHKLRGEYIPMAYKQATTLGADLNFAGQTYKAGQVVESQLRWNEFKIGYEFDPLIVDRGYVGGIVALSSMNVAGALANTAQSANTDVNILMPGLGIIARYYVASKASVTGEFMFFDLPGGATSTHAHSADIDGYLLYNFHKHAGVQLGYRSFDASHTWGSPLNTGSLTIRGPYVGGTARF